jgi:hypothetical protein
MHLKRTVLDLDSLCFLPSMPVPVWFGLSLPFAVLDALVGFDPCFPFRRLGFLLAVVHQTSQGPGLVLAVVYRLQVKGAGVDGL